LQRSADLPSRKVQRPKLYIHISIEFFSLMRHCITSTIQSKPNQSNHPISHTTLHYITLHYTTHYTTLHYTTLHTAHYNTMQYTLHTTHYTLQYNTLHYNTYLHFFGDWVNRSQPALNGSTTLCMYDK
jgi:hypothetical protein